jgi:hypothetical protein
MKYNLVYRGEILDTAHSYDEAEGLADIYKSDYGPEIKIVKSEDYVTFDEEDDVPEYEDPEDPYSFDEDY